MLSERFGWRGRAIGVRDSEESTSITGQVAPPSFPPAETNNEAASSQPQSFIESQNLVIADGQFNQIHGHHTSIVLNVNHSTSENTSTIEVSPSGSSNKTDHIGPGPPSASEPNHERTSLRTEVNQTIFTQKSSNDIYERHLISKRRGFPLWIPDPNQVLHLDYRRTGVRIGDVGIITHSGGFSFLFNICLPHDHPVNPRVLPEHFTPISPPIEATDIEKFLVFNDGSHLASASIKRSQSAAISDTGIVFESSASEGAILIMPRGARSEDLGNFARFREYAAANVADWYKFVNGPRGREAKNGDIRLVVGFDKTTSWGIATFANQTKQNSCRLKFGPSEVSASTYTWSENSGITDVRAGPNSKGNDELRIDSDPPDVQFENQCLFVRTLNVTLTDDVWADIHSTLGSVHVDPRHFRDQSASNRPHSSSPCTGSTSGSNLSPSPGAQYGTQRATGSIYGLRNVDLASDVNPGIFISGPPGSLTTHPSKVLNDILLAEVPTAKMAVTHDDDWSSVITQYDSTLPDPYNFTANILASRKIREENGVIFLQPERRPTLTETGTLGYSTFVNRVQERERSPTTCESCRSHKLECYSIQLDVISPCERCVKEQLLCEYHSPGSSTLFLPTIPMQEVSSTIPPKTYFTNFIVHAIRNIIPLPFLQPAFTIFNSIWASVKQAQTCQGQFRVLVSCTAAILEALDMQYRIGQLNEESTFYQLQDLTSLLQRIATFVQRRSSCSFLRFLFAKYQSLATIDAFHSQIVDTILAFQIGALVDIYDWQDEIDDARKADQQYLRLRLEQIGSNQLLLAEALNDEKNNPIAMMAAFKTRIDKKRGEQEELTFFGQSFRYLLATSGQQVDIKPWTISRFDVEFGEKTGVGGLGAVYRGIWNKTEVALKVMKNTENIIPHAAVVLQEVDTWLKLRHPNVLQFLGANILDDEPFMVTPWIANGNVLDYIKYHPHCDLLRIFEQIGSGLAYLHSQDVIHGDLRGVNILVDNSLPWNALLCDFGLSRIKADVNSRSIAGSVLVGSPNWMAPELFKGEELRFPCDVYSFAMTMYELFANKIPLGHIAPNMLRELVVDRNERPERPSMTEAPQLSDEIWTPIQLCWQAEPTNRPTADAVRSMLSSAGMRISHRISTKPLRNRGNPLDWGIPLHLETPLDLETPEDHTPLFTSPPLNLPYLTLPDYDSRGKVRSAGLSKGSVGDIKPRTHSTLGTTDTIRHSNLQSSDGKLRVARLSKGSVGYTKARTSSVLGTTGTIRRSTRPPLNLQHIPLCSYASASDLRTVDIQDSVSENRLSYTNPELEDAPTDGIQSLNISPKKNG